MQIQEANKVIRDASERTAHRHVNVPDMATGQMFCQGDIGVLAIRRLPKGAKKMERPKDGQIAPGNTTGSRHCIDESDAVTYYRFSGDPLSDICVDATKAWTLRHPKHGHATFEPGRYQLIQQQNEHWQRVRD